MQAQVPASLKQTWRSFGRNKCRVSGCMCRCLWVKTRSNRDKIWKSWQFCGSDFGSRFLATKMGAKSFYKKKLKGNRGRLHFGSRFWLPDLVVRSSSFSCFFRIWRVDGLSRFWSCGCVQEEAKFTRLHV